MNSKQIIRALKISDISVANIVIGKKKHNKRVPIQYNDKPLICQTPFLEVINDLRKTPHLNIYQLDTLFKGDNKIKMDNFFQFVDDLENRICEQVEINGADWFTQENVTIKPLIKELETTTNTKTFYIKWPIDLSTNIFVDSNKEPFDYANIKQTDLVKFIIEISNIWIHENQFGLAIIVQKIMVKPAPAKIDTEYIFNESDDDEDDKDDKMIFSLLATEQKQNVNLKTPVPVVNQFIPNKSIFNQTPHNQQEPPNQIQKSKIIDQSIGNTSQVNYQKDTIKDNSRYHNDKVNKSNAIKSNAINASHEIQSLNKKLDKKFSNKNVVLNISDDDLNLNENKGNQRYHMSTFDRVYKTKDDENDIDFE